MPLSSVSAPTAHTRTPGQTTLVVDRTGAQDAAVVRAAPTLRYVRKTGLDSNGGTSPVDAWLTIGKALTTVADNTIVYVGAGVYREVVTVTVTPSLGVSVIGDVDGSKTGDAGIVQWTAYLTNDKTAPSSTSLLNLNGKSNLAFRNLLLVSGNQAVVTAAATSSSITFTDCSFVQGFTAATAMVGITGAYNTPLNWLFDRCLFSNSNKDFITVTLTTGVGTDYDANVLVQNSVFVGSLGIACNVVNSGTLANKGGGVRVRNCLGVGALGMKTTASQLSTVYPCAVTNSAFLMLGNGGTCLNAGTAGQIVEDFNLIQGVTPRTNVTIGPHSISDGSYAPLIHFGQELQAGMFGRPFGEPMVGSPLLNFGNDGNQSTYDGLNRPRPTGSATALPAVGALERSNTFVKQTGTVHTGSNAISAAGPAYQDFLIPVDTTATTVSVFAQYNATYTGARPKLRLLGNPEIGVTELEAVMQGPSGAWEQLTLAPFTATANGIVTVRVSSYDTNGGGGAFFDTFAVA